MNLINLFNNILHLTLAGHLSLLCRVCMNFHPCDSTTGVLLPICPELCTDIEDNIEDCAIDFFEDYPAIDELFNVFECTEPETYFMNLPPQYIFNDGSGCTELCKYCTYACM